MTPKADALSRNPLQRRLPTPAATNLAVAEASETSGMLLGACKVAVEHPGFVGAMIVRPLEAGGFETAAVAVEGGFNLASFQEISDAVEDRGLGPTRQALRGDQAVYMDGSTDTPTAPWRALSLPHGIRSIAYLPLRIDDRPIACLTLLLKDAHVDQDKRYLLETLAKNVSLGLESLESTAEMAALNIANLTLAHISHAVVHATDAAGLFAAVCRIAVQEGAFRGACVVGSTEGGRAEIVAGEGGLDQALLTMANHSARPFDQASTSRTPRDNLFVYAPCTLVDRATGPGQDLLAVNGIQSVAILPLTGGGATVATLILGSRHLGMGEPPMLALLDAVAESISFGLAGLGAAAALGHATTEREGLLRRLESSQEDERSRIAGDVHDESVQGLAAVDLRLGMLRRQTGTEAPQLVPKIIQIQSMVNVVGDGLRLLLFDLAPADASLGLAELLSEAAGVILEGCGVRWSVDVKPSAAAETDDPSASGRCAEDDPWGLSEQTLGQALRMTKEALTNVRKHAKARHVLVVIRPVDDGVEVEITDDGIGASACAESRPGHRGLKTMIERARTAGGWCRIEARDPGTTVRFWLPLGTARSQLSRERRE